MYKASIFLQGVYGFFRSEQQNHKIDLLSHAPLVHCILQKRETSSAGEQPVRNNPIGRNGRGSDAPSFPLAIPVINDNNGKIYTFMTNLSPLQTYINRLCQIRRLRLRFFLQSQLFHATQELMIRNEHSACLNHTTYNNKTINSLVFARSISRSWQ